MEIVRDEDISMLGLAIEFFFIHCVWNNGNQAKYKKKRKKGRENVMCVMFMYLIIIIIYMSSYEWKFKHDRKWRRRENCNLFIMSFVLKMIIHCCIELKISE